MERNFLIVAADGKVREALAEEARKEGRSVTLAASGSEARRVVSSVSVDTVLVESHLPDTSGEDLRATLQQIRPDCRVVVLSSFKLVRNTAELLRFGAEDYLLQARQVFDLLSAFSQTRQGATPAVSRGEQALIHVVDVLVGLLELEHWHFSGSSHQVMLLTRATAEEMGADEEMLREVLIGALLRNVGKAGGQAAGSGQEVGEVENEREQRERGQVASFQLFEHVDFPWKVLPVIRHQHECYDGSGQPDGLRGREIPMGARIVSVVDAYVALTSSERGPGLDPEGALRELVGRAGHQFDPEVVEAFHRVIDKRLAGRKPKKKPTILIINGKEDFRRLLKMRLKNEGLDVLETASFEKALEQVLKSPPQLALVDLDEDVPGAFQLLAEIQQDSQLSRLPIAFMSKRQDRIVKLRALRQGVDDFLTKNGDMEELVARVENILLREALRTNGPTRRGIRGITGDLENLGLPDIVQTLVIGMKTACVRLASNERSGEIWFENGAPKHAATGQLEGEPAFYEMVRWSSGEFVIEHGLRAKRSSLNHDAMFLLMEGFRLMDESAEEAQAAS